MLVAGAALIGAFVLGRFSAEQPATERFDATDVRPEVFRSSLIEALGSRYDPLARSLELGRLMQALGPENVEIAAEVFEEYVFSTPEHEITLFMEVWSRFDALAALERAMTWPQEAKKRDTAVGAVVRAWARREPLEARLAVEQLSAELDDALRKPLVAGLAGGLIQSEDKASATSFLATRVPDEKTRTHLVRLLIAEIRRSSSDAELRAWAESIPDDEENASFKEVAFRYAAAALARDDPGAAGQWVARHADREYARGAIRRVALAWAESDPAAALGWLLDQPPGRTRRNAVIRVYRDWVRGEQEPAQAWLAAAGLPAELRSVLDELSPQPEVAP